MDEVVSYIGNLQTRYDWDKYCFVSMTCLPMD